MRGYAVCDSRPRRIEFWIEISEPSVKWAIRIGLTPHRAARQTEIPKTEEGDQ